MSTFTTPISMVAGSGKGAALAAGVIGLLLMLALASKSDPTARNQTIGR
ncbi:hypothetical protein [Simplicispira lacusdiani]|nr:hypothetical protein [Simplicispira lacusdiani]